MPVNTAARKKNTPAPMTTENPSKMVDSPANAPNPTTTNRLSTSTVTRFHASAAANIDAAMPNVENRYICSTLAVWSPAGNMRMISVEL